MAAAYYGKSVRHFDMYFKEKAPYLTDREYVKAYETSPEGWHEWSGTDCTPNIVEWIHGQIETTAKVVDVGGGRGGLWKNYAYPENVTICDIIDHGVNKSNPQLRFVKGLAHETRFKDKEFDLAVSSHVLEHVIYFTKSIQELIRISKKQIIVVPKQKYERFTLDYHVNFFPSVEQFLLRLIDSSVEVSKCKVFDIDDEICTIIQ
jgi:ubiquinone/menaquinone biosynthesis C-methylase UbiE